MRAAEIGVAGLTPLLVATAMANWMVEGAWKSCKSTVSL